MEPAKSGKYFYSDFYLERRTGFHELGMLNRKTNASYWMMITADGTDIGMFTEQCRTSGGCSGVSHPYDPTTKNPDYQGVEDFTDIHMYDKQKLTNVRYSGKWVKEDKMQMYFQQSARFLDMELQMLAVDQSTPAFD